MNCAGATAGAGFSPCRPFLLLRVPDEATQLREYAKFVADLKCAARLAAQTGEQSADCSPRELAG